MIGNWKLSIIAGLGASLFTFVFSLLNNTWLTSLIRSFIGFLCFCVFGYFLQLMLKQSLSIKNANTNRNSFLPGDIELQEELEKLVQEGAFSEESFQAVPLRSLHTGTEPAAAPEKIAETILAWTSQNQEG